MSYRKSVRMRNNNRTAILDNVHDLYYIQGPAQPDTGKDENMGKEPNFDLGGKPLKIDSGLVLDPNIVRLVKALARRAARQDFEANIEK